MPDPNNITYPFDPSGILPSNKILGEQHSVTEANYRDYYFIVPKYSPFFAESLIITHTFQGVTKVLIENLDYYCALMFIGATRAIGKPVYGAISLNNLNTSGIISVTYQTLGGSWNVDQQYVLEQIAEKAYNPRTAAWEHVVGVPEVFPPIPHQWDLVDLVGQTEVVEALNNIESAILQKAQTEWSSHIGNLENPHGVTKAHLDLDRLGNWGRATVAEAKEGLSTDTLIVPATLKAVITDYYNKAETSVIMENLTTTTQTNSENIAATAVDILTHLLDFNNPHKVNKANVGLDRVENFSVVTEADIIAGLPVQKYVTFDMLLTFIKTLDLSQITGGSYTPAVLMRTCCIKAAKIKSSIRKSWYLQNCDC